MLKGFNRHIKNVVLPNLFCLITAFRWEGTRLISVVALREQAAVSRLISSGHKAAALVFLAGGFTRWMLRNGELGWWILTSSSWASLPLRKKNKKIGFNYHLAASAWFPHISFALFLCQLCLMDSVPGFPCGFEKDKIQMRYIFPQTVRKQNVLNANDANSHFIQRNTEWYDCIFIYCLCAKKSNETQRQGK